MAFITLKEGETSYEIGYGTEAAFKSVEIAKGAPISHVAAALDLLRQQFALEIERGLVSDE